MRFRFRFRLLFETQRKISMRAAGEQTGEPSSDGHAEHSAESAASDDLQLRTFGQKTSLNRSEFTFQAPTAAVHCDRSGLCSLTQTEPAAETVLQETGNRDSPVSEDAAAQCRAVYCWCWNMSWVVRVVIHTVWTPQVSLTPECYTGLTSCPDDVPEHSLTDSSFILYFNISVCGLLF